MSKLERYIVYAICPILLGVVFYTMVVNTSGPGYLYIPMVGEIILLMYMELFILPSKAEKRWMGSLLLLVSILLNMILGIFGRGEVYHVFYILTLFSVIRYFDIKKSLVITAFYGIMLCFIAFFRKRNPTDFLNYWIKWCMIYAVAIGIMYMIKYMLNQNEKLLLARKKLTEKNLDLSQALEQLTRAYDELEDYTIMKERNNMSREMHDTVGHTLTATLVEIEVCKLMAKDHVELKCKLEHIGDQVRQGLSDLRVTVRQLKQDLDWCREIQLLGERLERYAQIKVKYQMGRLDDIEVSVLRCTYRIIQEGITNGIKHGKATAFMIRVERKKDQLEVEVLDNGIGATGFKQGFGLTAMTERVQALGGTIRFESCKGEGFTIYATLPCKKVEC